MSHPLILVPRTWWSPMDKLRALVFPRRAPTVPPASWLGELMEKRFGCVFICERCKWRYGDAIQRLGYVRHPDNKAQGQLCDACKTYVPLLAIWNKEEHRYPTAQEHAEQSRRFGIAGPPHLYDRRWRVS